MMRRLILTLILACTLIFTPATRSATEYSRTFTLTGGSSQKLSTVIAAQSYTGTVSVDELTIYNPAAANVYRGQSDVSATNGAPIPPNVGYTERATNNRPIDISQVYVFCAADQSVTIIVRGY